MSPLSSEISGCRGGIRNAGQAGIHPVRPCPEAQVHGTEVKLCRAQSAASRSGGRDGAVLKYRERGWGTGLGNGDGERGWGAGMGNGARSRCGMQSQLRVEFSQVPAQRQGGEEPV